MLLSSQTFSQSVTFDFETAVTGYGTKTLTNTISGRTLVVNSTTANIYRSVNDYRLVPITGTETMLLGDGLPAETAVTFSLQNGKAFDLISFKIRDETHVGVNPTITTSSNKSANFGTLSRRDVTTVNTSSFTTPSDFNNITSFTITSGSGFTFSLDDLAMYILPTRVTSVTSSKANGTYKAGEQISIQVNFSENVTVTGTPQLTLETGSTDRTINYASGTNTSTLNFYYTVQAGDISADLDYNSTTALVLNGGAIINGAGETASLTLPTPGATNSLGANKNIVIDTQAPTTTGISVSFSNDTGSSQSDLITSAASQTISGKLDANLVAGEEVYVSLDNGMTYAPATISVGTKDWNLAGVILAGSNTIKVRVEDAVGNRGSVYAASYAIDTQSPIVMGVANGGLYNTNKAITFNEGFATINSAAFTSGTTVVSDGSYTFVATDAAGNTTTVTFTIDKTALTVAITSSKSTLKIGETASITFTFSEAVTGFTAADISFINGSGSGFSVTGDPKVYTVLFTPTAGINNATATISLAASSYTDAAGNAGGSESVSIAVDTKAPDAPVVTSPTNESTITNDKPTFTVSGEIYGTVTIYIDGVYVGSFTINSSGIGTFKIITALANGIHTVRAIIIDDAGNVSASSNTNTFTVNTALPVNLIRFDAKAENKVAKLQWQTASEQNNKGFEIYRSGDDKQFVKIGDVVGSGNSNKVNNYYFTDSQPLNGNNYYRLVQADNNGATTTLTEKALTFSLSTISASAYPNPAQQQVTLNFVSAKYQKLILTGLDGRVLMQQYLKADQTKALIDISKYANGLYLVKLKGQTHEEVIKVIKI